MSNEIATNETTEIATVTPVAPVVALVKRAKKDDPETRMVVASVDVPGTLDRLNKEESDRTRTIAHLRKQARKVAKDVIATEIHESMVRAYGEDFANRVARAKAIRKEAKERAKLAFDALESGDAK